MTDQPFCEAFWFVDGRRHACLYRTRHAGSCWCCEAEGEYPGGDLSLLEPATDSYPSVTDEPVCPTCDGKGAAGWDVCPDCDLERYPSVTEGD